MRSWLQQYISMRFASILVVHPTLMVCRAEGEKLVAAGLMLEGLEAAATGQQFGDTIWTFTRPQAKSSSGVRLPIGRHKLSAGANVAVLPMPAPDQPGQPSQVQWCCCLCYLGVCYFGRLCMTCRPQVSLRMRSDSKCIGGSFHKTYGAGTA